MNYIDALILGFVQGITEFVPISSSGHLIIVDKLFSTQSTFGYDALLNIGTLMALIIYFKSELHLIFTGILKKKDWKLAKNIIISTIPAALIGYLLSDTLEGGIFRQIPIVALMLFIVGLIMVLEPRLHKADQNEAETLSGNQALNIGLAQAVALIPGTSRSGMTILAGRFSGLSNKESARYSFLIAIPIIAGAILKTVMETGTQELFNSSRGIIIVGITTSFITGYFAISVMLKFLRNHNLASFGYYRIALSILLLLTLL